MKTNWSKVQKPRKIFRWQSQEKRNWKCQRKTYSNEGETKIAKVWCEHKAVVSINKCRMRDKWNAENMLKMVCEIDVHVKSNVSFMLFSRFFHIIFDNSFMLLLRSWCRTLALFEARSREMNKNASSVFYVNLNNKQISVNNFVLKQNKCTYKNRTTRETQNDDEVDCVWFALLAKNVNTRWQHQHVAK